MPPIRKKYLLTISVLALLLGAVFFWRGQSGSPELQLHRIDLGPDAANIAPVDELAPETGGVSSSAAPGSSSSVGLQPASETIDRPAIEASTSAASAAAPNRPSGLDQSPSETPAAPTLSPRVYDVISEVQSYQLAGEWEEALNEMNALYRDLDQLTPFEQVTLLNFYTNTLARLEMWQESITAFNMILQVPDLRPDVNARALMALGQLHARVGEGLEGVAYLEGWLDYTAGMESMDTLAPRVNNMITCLQNSAGDSASCTL